MGLYTISRAKSSFDLLLKNFNLGRSFLTRRGRANIFHMCIPCDRKFHAVQFL